MPDLLARKSVELARKCDGLDAELQHWLDATGAVDSPLRTHHSQVRAIADSLKGLRAAIFEQAGAAGGNPNLLADARDVQRMVLGVYRIWEYFRGKLAQRSEAAFSPYLRSADELAWACYRTIRNRCYPDPVDVRRREPPLVFLNGGLSPFAVARDHTFTAEDVPGEFMSAPPLKRVLAKLPIPVIGVPWFQVRHLPDALVIAHETGHAIEEDFNLNPRLRELLGAALDRSKASASRRDAWVSWLGEAFADLYGCLACGPAFATTLMDFLAAPPADIAAEQPMPGNWGLYPTRHLRIQLCAAALDHLGFSAEAEAVSKQWRTLYAAHAMPQFEADLPEVVAELLGAQHSILGDASLESVFRFEVAQQTAAADVLAQLHADDPLDSTNDVRVLFAAVRLSFESDPAKFFESLDPAANPDLSRAGRLLSRINAVIGPEVRADSQTLSDADVEARSRAQAGAAATIIDLWRGQ